MSQTALQPPDTTLPVSLLVALDGSLFAERALAPACRLAAGLGAEVHLWSAVPSPAEAEERRRRLQAQAEACGASWDVTVGERPVEAISPTGDGDRLVCLATHGRDRTAGLAHSVSAAVVAASVAPVLLVGPKVPAQAPAGKRLVACVDGSRESEGILPLSMAWAKALELDVTILTVAEPVLESVLHPGTYPRLHGPHGDADAYVAGLADTWHGPVAVDGQVIYDPVDVDGAIVAALARDAAHLVVMGTRSPQGLRRVLFGSTAAAVAHRAPAPVLVVPL
jgi:nucleotide-binding universal stress UspA family protein